MDQHQMAMDETEEMFPGQDAPQNASVNHQQTQHQFNASQNQTPTTPTSQTGVQFTPLQGGSDEKGKANYHEKTGYTWERPEDEPGYMWKSRKGQEEMMRAFESIVDKDKNFLGKERPSR